MNRKAAILFRVGTWTLIVIALLHLAGHLAPRQEPEEVTALGRTYLDFLSGFSLAFPVLLLFAGAMNLSVLRFASANAALVGRVTILNVLLAAMLVALSLAYFIPPPAILFGVALIAFGASAGVSLRRGSS